MITTNITKTLVVCAFFISVVTDTIYFAFRTNASNLDRSLEAEKDVVMNLCQSGCGHEPAMAEQIAVTLLPAEQQAKMLKDLQDFKIWFDEFRKERNQYSYNERILAIKLATARKEAMAQLIEMDPDGALRNALSYSEYAALPSELKEIVERPFSTVGDLDVHISCGQESSQYHYSMVDSMGKRFVLFMPAKHRASMTKSKLPLQGIVLEEKVVIRGETFQMVDEHDAAFVESQWPAGQADLSVDFVSGQAIQGKGITAVAAGLVFRFQNNESLEHINRVMAEADAKPGLDNGSSRLLLEASGGSLMMFAEQQFIQQSLAASSSATTGSKTALFIIINFQDDVSNPDSSNQLESIIDSEVNDALQRYSYSQTSIDATVHGQVLTLPYNKSRYSFSRALLYTDALNAYQDLGGANRPDPLTIYDTVGILFPYVGYPWDASASVGGQQMWLQNTISSTTILHEFGHIFGLRHAEYWQPSNSDPVDPTGTSLAYGDLYDVMGLGEIADGFFNVGPTTFLGWIASHDWQDLSSPDDNGIYRVHRFDHGDSSGLRGLRVAKSATSDHYWISYRNDYQDISYFPNGAMLHWERGNGDPDRNMGWLIDTTPDSPNGRADSPISLGRTYSDPNSDVHITALTSGGSAPNEFLDIAVNFGPFPENQNPTGVLIGESSVVSGQTVLFNVEAIDPNGDTLVYDWDMGDGEAKPNTAAVSHSWANSGTFTVVLTVSDMKGGSLILQQTVEVQEQSLTWTNGISGTTNTLHDIANSGSSAVVVGAQVILRSTDGETWTNVTPSIGFSEVELFGICWSGNDYVAVGAEYNAADSNIYRAVIYSSVDGASWTRVVESEWSLGTYFNAAASDGAGLVVVVGEKGFATRRSASGTWSDISSIGISSSFDLDDIAYGENLFLALGAADSLNGSLVLYSTDGQSWSDYSSGGFPAPGYQAYLWSKNETLHYTGSHFVASGYFNRVSHSLDQGRTWNNTHADLYNDISGFASGGGFVYGVGVAEARGLPDIDLISTDGIYWTTIDPGDLPTRNAINFFANRFITVGENGSIRQTGSVSADTTTYTDYAATYFPEDGDAALPSANVDGDWADNLTEYALGGDLSSGTSAPMFPTFLFNESGEPVFEVFRNKRRSDIAYSIWWSSDLTNWTRQGLTVEDDNDDTIRAVADGQDISSGRGFFRLQLQQR